MVKIRYMYYYPRVKKREAEIRNAVLSESVCGPAVHYESGPGHTEAHYSVLGTYTNSDGFVDFITSLVIDGKEYRAETIREHYAEIQVLLDRERTERLLEEIDDDQGSFEDV